MRREDANVVLVGNEIPTIRKRRDKPMLEWGNLRAEASTA
jgi:hypothetical protein